ADGAHHCGNRTIRFRLRLGDTALGERDRGKKGSAPGSEILGCELLAHVLADVLVHARAGEVAEPLAIAIAVAVAVAVAKQPATTLQREHLADRLREPLLDAAPAHEGSVRGAQPARDLAATAA